MDGRIILLEIPIKQYEQVGRLAQVIYKTIWQRAIERRTCSRPVFLWADEAQYFVTREDALFQQTARAKLAATVYLTQNLPNYYAALDGAGSTAATESLLGNLQTKFFHANGDPATNEWAERVFGKVLSSRQHFGDASAAAHVSREQVPIVQLNVSHSYCEAARRTAIRKRLSSWAALELVPPMCLKKKLT